MSQAGTCLIKHAKKIDIARIQSEAKVLMQGNPSLDKSQAMTKVAEGILAELRGQEQLLLFSKTNPSTTSQWSGGDTITIDGKPRSTLNSNGKPIAQTEEGLRNFWKWFGDSKVTDDAGLPLVVYHSTQSDFDSFSKDKIGSAIDSGQLGAGFYFTTSVENANNYARNLSSNTGIEGGEHIRPVYLSIKKPKIAHSLNSEKELNSKASNKISDKIQAKGFDGIKYDTGYDATWFVTFNPNQIKSAIGNNENFDPSNNDIRYSIAPNQKSPAFTRWFGNSKMKRGGEPIRFYHGSQNEFTVYDRNLNATNTSHTTAGLGHFFTENEDEAANYGGNIHEVFLSIENPYVTTSEILSNKFDDAEGAAKFADKLKADGFDGIYIKDAKYAVAFASNQVKLTSNEQPSFGNDIRFSIASNVRDSVPSPTEINSAIRDYLTPRKGKQPLGWLAGIFQRNHLIDFAAKELPMLEDYKTLSQEKDNTINQSEHEIATTYQKMKDSLSSAEMTELGRVQGMATRLKDFDPEKFHGDITELNADEKKVLMAFRRLPDAAKSAYVQMRDDYTKDLQAKKRALIERISEFPMDRITRGEIIKQIESHFDQHIKKGVYFPLSRNGNIVVTAQKLDDNGEEIPEERVVSFVEDGKAKDKLIAEMQAQGYKHIKTTLKDVYIKSLADNNAAQKIAALATRAIADLETNLQQQDAGATLDFAGFNANDIIKGGNYNDLLNEFNQLLIEALPDVSYRKHFIHRKGTLGYSTDTLRAYAGTRSAAAKNIAGLKFNHKITGKLAEADKAVKEMDAGADNLTDTGALKSVLNELQLREDKLKSTAISQPAQVLTSLGFMGALGLNVASAAVNMLQVPGVTLPELAGKHGVKAATSEINKAYKLLFNKNVLEKESGFNLLKNPDMNKPENRALKQALQQLNDIGKIDLTMTHDAIAMGQNPSYSDNALTRAAGGIAKYSGYMFHVAEALNRQVTGIAAFNLAYAQNGGNYEEAFKSAVDTIDRTQFDYSQGNRARYMMGDTARVLTLFKSYALGISYYIGRNVHNALKGETPEIRLAARKTLATQMAMTFATSGLFGLPIGAEAFAALGGVAGFKYKGATFAVPGAIGGMLVFQALLAGLGADDEDDLETDFRNWLTDNFDQTTAEWITKGPARLLPIGDISGRTGLSDIWWRSQNKELEGKDQYQAFANALMGPLGSQIAGFFTAKKMYEDGEYKRMVESMSPAFIRNAVAAARLESEGAKTLKGDPIIDRDLTAGEIFNKVLGFNPTVLTNSYDANTAITKERDKINMKKAHLVNRYIAGDAQARAELMSGDIKEFNDSVEPTDRITMQRLIKSIRQRKSLDKRTDNGLYLSKRQAYLRDKGRFFKGE